MTATAHDSSTSDPALADLGALDVAWDLEPLLQVDEGGSVESLLSKADALADRLAEKRGLVATFTATDLAEFMTSLADLHDVLGRAGSYAGLRFAVDTADAEVAATMQKVEEHSVAVSTKLLFFELEWAQLDDAAAEQLLSSNDLAWCAHHLRSIRRYRDHLLSEPEERILAEKSISGASAWARLFSEQTSAIVVELPSGPAKLEMALSLLADPSHQMRRTAAEAITEALNPGLRTRAFIYNTLLADKATDDRLRSYPTWITSRNLANEATDESVQALVDSVQARYDIPQAWYRLKAKILGVDRLADYDRMASVAESESQVGWAEARELVLDAYQSFSPEMAEIAERFFAENWIDAPVRDAKRPGAFCAYTVPSHHPYLMLNWTGRRRDVLTLAHEMGHGLHAYLSREQGIFHQSTPLTLAETASVFGETVTFGRLLEATTDPRERLALLAESIEGAIATVFRQTAMNRFENAVHLARREQGELSVDTFGQHWLETQGEMLGDAVELSPGYATWWSYIPHFIGTPGYVYAYAYGQLLALSVYARYETEGHDFVSRYMDLLSSGGSLPPEELGLIVGVDLSDPGFWDGGLAIVQSQLEAAETAAHDAGVL
ncbi:MAG: M3 family oligoendopeptidase [Acidimicrobiia bacterium]